MALSEREQRLLAEIESALTEDQEFTDSVAKAQRDNKDRTVLRGWTLIAVGALLLVGGFFVKIASFPLISLLGFLVMFGGGLMLIKHSDNPTNTKTAKKKTKAKKAVADDNSNDDPNGLAGSFYKRFER
ncbi:MAG: DUF3040 domain-containing protein [Lawsonella sp.]|nr:DUF3040 domain-containing protein [Mycobacteriales bacterium]